MIRGVIIDDDFVRDDVYEFSTPEELEAFRRGLAAGRKGVMGIVGYAALVTLADLPLAGHLWREEVKARKLLETPSPDEPT